MNTHRRERRIPLLISMPHSCSYLQDQLSSNAFVDPDREMDMGLYGQLLRAGFRRSGRIVYRPHCAECQQCLSLRIPVEMFQERRRHRRIREKNQHVRLVTSNPRLQAEHFDLYRRYTASRHTGGSMAGATPAEYMEFLTAPWSETVFLEMREDERLLGIAVTDLLGDGLSAVYCFFDPDLPQRSLGVFAILSQISMARQLGLPYLYLGYWIRDCSKMSYKADYRPMQVFSGGRWVTFQAGQEVDLPELGRQGP